jgi:hypothetical protein
MASNKAIEIATIRLMFLLVIKFTTGFRRIAIIIANASGINMLRNSNSTNTNRITPNRVTVDLKKKGNFFFIKKIEAYT